MSKSIDHIIPVSKGGADAYHNVQLAHILCNQKKSNAYTLNDYGYGMERINR